MASRKRIWGWMIFDLAQQPYATLGLTFIFAPYFAAVATERFAREGLDPGLADARAQSLWASGQTVAGLVIAFTAPVLGAMADASGRRMPWIAGFSVITVICAALLWMLTPDGSMLVPALALFFAGFVAAESATNVNNALLPSLATGPMIGRISGSGAALGYWGGVASLIIMLLLLAENDRGVTLLGRPPAFGLDPEAREGTRAVGPVIAIWYAVFIIPFFAWVRDAGPVARAKVTPRVVMSRLGEVLRDVMRRPSLAAFLGASMLYRDALAAVYAFGGIYATLVLGWSVIQIGVFGIIGAIAAAVLTWAGGLADQRLGPKPVIRFCCWVLIGVSVLVVSMSRDSLFGVTLAEGSRLPDILFYLCGALIGGAGGALYAASRSLMVRHADPTRATEAFGLFALSGRATAFLAPMSIGLATWMSGSTRAGLIPVIVLFALGLFLLRWVDRNGDRAA
ncbi:MFS transporter, UMF1 family [Limimaricola pyoseonensis]|uniref:MFS transporter, UMF1 family n=2 Tax=Limimaricola pyoseonensis TaxID=521013 RepID=A0A1G7ED77_9RHOB|nr:MFS transporter [Limimaricola pyoseonensis]SDE61557.1 MFS transporter, UMF1 family [Limimaricola pyoseonensis]